MAWQQHQRVKTFAHHQHGNNRWRISASWRKALLAKSVWHGAHWHHQRWRYARAAARARAIVAAYHLRARENIAGAMARAYGVALIAVWRNGINNNVISIFNMAYHIIESA